jgi:hypothetical protein
MVLFVRMDTGLGAETSSSWERLVLSTQHNITTHHAYALVRGHFDLLQLLTQSTNVQMESSTVPVHANIWKHIKYSVLQRTTCYCLVKENLNIIHSNARYHWGQYLPSPHFLSRNMKIKIYNTVISPIFKLSHIQRRTQTTEVDEESIWMWDRGSAAWTHLAVRSYAGAAACWQYCCCYWCHYLLGYLPAVGPSMESLLYYLVAQMQAGAEGMWVLGARHWQCCSDSMWSCCDCQGLTKHASDTKIFLLL